MKNKSKFTKALKMYFNRAIIFIAIFPILIYSLIKYIFILPENVYWYLRIQYLRVLSTLPNQIREKILLFDVSGLRFHIEHLNSIDANNMMYWPIEKRVLYVDSVVYNMVKNKTDQQLMGEFFDVDFSRINATAIGNLSYVAEYSNNKQMRKFCYDLLDQISEYYLPF